MTYNAQFLSVRSDISVVISASNLQDIITGLVLQSDLDSNTD